MRGMLVNRRNWAWLFEVNSEFGCNTLVELEPLGNCPTIIYLIYYLYILSLLAADIFFLRSRCRFFEVVCRLCSHDSMMAITTSYWGGRTLEIWASPTCYILLFYFRPLSRPNWGVSRLCTVTMQPVFQIGSVGTSLSSWTNKILWITNDNNSKLWRFAIVRTYVII